MSFEFLQSLFQFWDILYYEQGYRYFEDGKTLWDIIPGYKSIIVFFGISWDVLKRPLPQGGLAEIYEQNSELKEII